jgi:hypothetical protein
MKLVGFHFTKKDDITRNIVGTISITMKVKHYRKQGNFRQQPVGAGGVEDRQAGGDGRSGRVCATWGE